MRSPINVLHVIKTLNLGGAETNLLNLVRAFDPAVVKSHVAYSYGGEIEPRFRAAGIDLFKYAGRPHKVKSPYSLLIAWRLARYVRRQSIDIIQTHNFNAHIWGLMAARVSGAKVVEHVHDFRYTPTDELIRRRGFMRHYQFIKYFRKQSDVVVLLTDDHLRHVVEEGMTTADRAIKIPNGIPFDDLPVSNHGRRGELGIDDDAVVVLTSARMEPSKNIDLIIRIASHVRALSPKVVFVIAGDGDYLDVYRASASATGVDADVRFIGFQQDMDSLLEMADIFLLPSFLELHSIAILEAMKMGRPVVISAGVGCNDEFIEDGVDGFLCDPFDDTRWIEVIGRLSSDRPLRTRVGMAGRKTCRRLFDLASTARRFESLYESLTN